MIIPRVFFDDNFLAIVSKKYDPVARIVKNHVGDNILRVSLELIREVFKLNTNHTVHENIGKKDL